MLRVWIKMKIIALNAGSSSIKYRVLDSEQNYQVLAKGIAERIGQKTSSITQIAQNGAERKIEISLPDHQTAMHALFPAGDPILKGIDAIGHRIVHGGERFKSPVLINKEVIKEIAELARFAPLHCQPNVIGIEVLQELINVPQVAVFDTAPFATMEEKAFLYGLPMAYYEKHKIRKYGFHGINHVYVATEAAQYLKKPLESLKMITCHLGNGCSITPFEKGKCIDNSMGLTPLEGLVMGTRCGDLDPSVVLYLIDELKMQTTQITDLLNKQSGLLGLCGKNDMRDIIKQGDKFSQLAIEVFVYRIQKYIGAYAAALNGVDAIVFTGGIGENSPYIRELIMKNFSYLGASVDNQANETNKILFSTADSALFLLTIPANEELVIARQTHQLIATAS
jgi:acetate kinase